MSVYKRKGSPFYHISFSVNGRHYQHNTRQGDYEVAKQIEAAYRTQLAKGEVGIEERKKVPTLREFQERFLEHIRASKKTKPATVRFYEEKFDRLLDFQALALSPLDRINKELIDRFIIARSKQVSGPTINRALATLRRALRLAHDWEMIDRVPKFEMQAGERSRDFVLSTTSETLYLEMAQQPLRDIALLMLDTGLRISESLELRWSDVKLEPIGPAKYGFVRIRAGKSKNAGRTVPLTARVVQMLKDRSAIGGSDTGAAPVFVWNGRRRNRNGRIVATSLNHLHRELATMLKLPRDFVLHSFRHTFLTRLGESGVDAFTIKRIAGHSSITVSERYIHPTPEAVERAFDRLSATLLLHSAVQRL